MSDYYCQRCGEFKGVFPDRHRCIPEWVTIFLEEKPKGDLSGDWLDEYPQKKYYAHDAKAAAEKAAAVYHSDWLYEIDSFEIAVIRAADIKHKLDDNEEDIIDVWPRESYKYFVVTVEPIPEYTATEETIDPGEDSLK